MAKTLPAPVKAPAVPRGAMVDVGEGRRLRVMVDGDRRATRGHADPLILCEAGAFGCGADFAAVQAVLSPRMRVLTYDRAGLCHSEPGPAPRDSLAITNDLHAALQAMGEAPPYLLVAHSMAAVHAQVFALRWPHEVAGIVFVDAVPPDYLARPGGIRTVKGAARLAAIGRASSVLRLAALSAPLFGDAIGLVGAAHAEKLHAFASPAHNHWAAMELECWLADAEQARALGELDRELPVATITAGPGKFWWKAMQAEPARRSRSGYVENVSRANHATLLGPKHCDAVVRGVDFVMKAALALG